LTVRTQRAESVWPPDGLERVGDCPICGAHEREVLHDGLTDRTFFSAPGSWTLHRCARCAAAFLDPRPNRATIGQAYSSYFTHEHAAPMLGGVDFRTAVRNGYLNRRYGYQLTPASRLGPIAAGLLPKRRWFADRLVRNLRRPLGRGRLLDIGSGEGTFLAAMSRLGWEVQGLEPDPQAAALSRKKGVPVIEAPLEEASLNAESFDAATMSHVIEHFHDPIDALRACHTALRPGGTLWIATPNLEARGHALFGRDWIGLDPPRHLVVFTRASLVNALEQAHLALLSFEVDYSVERVFPPSAAVAAGEDPRDERLVARRRSRMQIFASDLVVRLRPERSEDIVLVAERPKHDTGFS
jgi:SAM-dependent methyltransferase